MTQLHQSSFSLDHQALVEILATEKNILIIQDLDGVCMGLVKDPLTRTIEPNYLAATQAFDKHFFVLTNGEHIGKRGINLIVEKALNNPELVKQKGLYLPGLAGGGVQWQDRYGNVSHPGINNAELAFLATVPSRMQASLKTFFREHNCDFSDRELDAYIYATVLENKVSPSINLNVFYDALSNSNIYNELQKAIEELMQNLLEEAKNIGLENSFFIHFAPNLGRDERGKEIMQPASAKDSGTTDFQFMLKGAVKEAGVLFILNHYYYLQTGDYPLGKDFNSRQSPQSQTELLALIKDNFAPEIMPRIIGVGDTVTSKSEQNGNEIIFRRGGSDRGFLELIQAMNQEFNTHNLVVYIDSSAGEVKNRKPLKFNPEKTQIIEGPGDVRDLHDPLILNVVFPNGDRQYTQMFQTAASRKAKLTLFSSSE
jgi:glucosylglycerol 3-phosphatase